MKDPKTTWVVKTNHYIKGVIAAQELTNHEK